MSNPTSNFNWQMPTATDLVTDLPADFEVFGQAVDTTMADLKGGTTGQILSKATNTDMDFVWTSPNPGDITAVTAGTGISGGGTSGDVTITNSMATAITTSGDLIQGTGSGTFARLATGTSGQYLTTNGTTNSWGTIGGLPTSFTLRFTPSTGWTPRCIATNGSTIYVAVGTSGTIYSSTDSGTTWASRTSGFGAVSILSVAFGNGIFVAVGGSGIITTSTDGITWTARTANVAANQINHVGYVNNLFIACANGANGGTGGITTSTDGITWTKRTTPTTSSTQCYSVTYGGGFYVVAGDLNTRAGYYSTDAVTWTVLPAGVTATIEFVYYNGSNFFALNQTGNGFYVVGAPSGTWATINSQPNPYVVSASANTTTSVYNGFMYYFTSTSRVNAYKTAIGMTGNLLNGSQPQVNFPNDGNSETNALFIDSNGKLTTADRIGRIYTAQL